MAANVKSIDSIRHFRSDLQDYRDSIRQSLDILTTEINRAIEYFESDRAAYWPAEERKASEQVSEARTNLSRCQMTTRDGQQRSCVEEKKTFQKAKDRLQLTREKVKATKKWIRIVQHEADLFKARLAQLSYLADTDLPRAIALLERLANRLDRYANHSKSAESHSGDSN